MWKVKMSVNEAVLIILMRNFVTKYQRVLALEKYVQNYGALSEEACEKVRKLIGEAKDEHTG